MSVFRSKVRVVRNYAFKSEFSSFGAIFRPASVQGCHLGRILEELTNPAHSRLNRPKIFEIQIFNFGVAPFIHLGHFIVLSTESLVFWPLSTYTLPRGFEVFSDQPSWNSEVFRIGATSRHPSNSREFGVVSD